MMPQSQFVARAVSTTLGLVATTFPAFAYAQSSNCSDILANGVFDTYVSKHSDVYHEIIINRFLSSSYEYSKKEESAFNGKSVGEIVMGSGYSAVDFDKKKDSMKNDYTREINHEQEWQLAISTGDDKIISAWQLCMGNHKGLFARFKAQPLSPREATLIIEFYGNPGDITRLDDDVYLPQGITAPVKNQKRRCLSKGAILKSDVPCSVNINFATAVTSGSVVIHGSNVEAEAYIAPRLTWVSDQKPFNATENGGAKRNDSANEPFNFPADLELLNQGYLIKLDSVRYQLGVTFGGGEGGNCSNLKVSSTVFGVSGTYSANASRRIALGCKLVVSGILERQRMEPAKEYDSK